MSSQLTRLFCMKVESTRAARRPYIHRGLGEADGRSPACRGMFRELKIKADMFTIPTFPSFFSPQTRSPSTLLVFGHDYNRGGEHVVLLQQIELYTNLNVLVAAMQRCASFSLLKSLLLRCHSSLSK